MLKIEFSIAGSSQFTALTVVTVMIGVFCFVLFKDFYVEIFCICVPSLGLISILLYCHISHLH